MRVVVVGAGIFGASTAYHLSRAGAEVVMVDPMREGRATAAGAGIICPWSANVTDPHYYALTSGGARYYPELVARLAEDGETELSYRRVGALCLDSADSPLDQTEARARARAKDAPEAGAISRLSPAEARALFPPLRPDASALHIEGAARIDGRLMAAALCRAARLHGASMRETEVSRLVMSGARVTGVETDGGRIDADEVVLTAGAWAPALLAPLRVALPVAPQRGQILHLRLPDQDTSRWPVVLPMTSHYLLAFDDSRVVVGATRETGSGFDYRLTAGGVMQELQCALDVAPGLASATLHEMRIGMRPMGPDARPMLGRVEGLDGLTIGNGLGPSGLTIGPYAGALLARLVLGQRTDIPLAPYAPLRG